MKGWIKTGSKWLFFGVLMASGVVFLSHCGRGGGSFDAGFCFSCHGENYSKAIDGVLYPDDLVDLTISTSYVLDTQVTISPRTDSGIVINGDLDRLPGFSNKELEFDPGTDDVDSKKIVRVNAQRFGTLVPSHTQQRNNPAYHPVSGGGRNGSWQLCNQLAGRYKIDCGCGPGETCSAENNSPGSAVQALSGVRVFCWDCHDSTGSATYEPTGEEVPHRLDQGRLLNGAYNTGVLAPGRCFSEGNPPGCLHGDGFDPEPPYGSNDAHFNQFDLCFQCHDRRAFDPDLADEQDPRWTRFFGVKGEIPQRLPRDGNLHMYHLRWTGALCHECHYNVHSNVEAINTIFADGLGGELPPDGEDGIEDGVIGTHLIDFAPTVEGTVDVLPKWFYDGSTFRCYLRCHNEIMNSCAYLASTTSSPDAENCAGGEIPGRAG